MIFFVFFCIFLYFLSGKKQEFWAFLCMVHTKKYKKIQKNRLEPPPIYYHQLLKMRLISSVATHEIYNFNPYQDKPCYVLTPFYKICKRSTPAGRVNCSHNLAR
eukprot:sb/3478098/